MSALSSSQPLVIRDRGWDGWREDETDERGSGTLAKCAERRAEWKQGDTQRRSDGDLPHDCQLCFLSGVGTCDGWRTATRKSTFIVGQRKKAAFRVFNNVSWKAGEHYYLAAVTEVADVSVFRLAGKQNPSKCPHLMSFSGRRFYPPRMKRLT